MAEPPKLLRPTLPDRYLVGDPIGHSSGARVWMATDTATGDKVAVKTPLYADNHDAHLPERLTDEYRITSAFRHPNIMRVVDVIVSGEPYSPALVAELVDGQTFQNYRNLHGAATVERVAANERSHRARLNRRNVELLLPHPSMDIYSAGVLLYEAATGERTRTTLDRVIDRTGSSLPPLGESSATCRTRGRRCRWWPRTAPLPSPQLPRSARSDAASQSAE